MRKLNQRRGILRRGRPDRTVRPRCGGARRKQQQPSVPAVETAVEPTSSHVPYAIIRISSVIIIVVGVPGPG